ncbi:MAG: hypothetical protein ACX93T_00390 [Bacteroidota bacterium]
MLTIRKNPCLRILSGYAIATILWGSCTKIHDYSPSKAASQKRGTAPDETHPKQEGITKPMHPQPDGAAQGELLATDSDSYAQLSVNLDFGEEETVDSLLAIEEATADEEDLTSPSDIEVINTTIQELNQDYREIVQNIDQKELDVADK